MMSDVFVGRQQELERLCEAFDGARDGRGSLVMVTGEPGIGKTRLARELEGYASEQGARVLWGRAHEAGGAPPYWPWVQALRSLVESVDGEELRSWLGSGASEVPRIIPELRERLPDLPDPEPIVEPESAQFRLFDATATFIRNAASTTPLMVVLDDLQWADKSTLQLLEHVALELGRASLLVIGTYRDVELGRQHPLERALAGIGRAERFQTVDLRGLSKADSAAYVRATTGTEPSAAAMNSIYRETEGNAFFLQEVVALMSREGTRESSQVSVPPSVRAAVGHRLNALSEECNTLLRVAAVVGREFTQGLLMRLSDEDTDQLSDLLETALGAGLIEETGAPGEYRFTHALVQETLLHEVRRTGQRVTLHARIAQALEALHGDRAAEHAAELASHFVESAAVDRTHVEQALRYSQVAGQRAEQETAWEDAAAHYERALVLTRDAGGELEQWEPELLTAMGRCYRNVAQHDAAWRALSEAVKIYRERGDGEGFARATIETRKTETIETHAGEERLIPLEDEALSLLAGADEHLEAKLSIQRARWGWGEAEERAANRAERLTRTHGYRDVEALLLDRESHRAWEEQRFDDAQQGARAAHEAFDKLGNYALASHHLHDAAIGHVFAGELDEATATAVAGLEYARRYHNRFYERASLFALTIPSFVRCEHERVEQSLGECDEIDSGHFTLRMLRAGRLEMSEAFEQATSELPEVDDGGGVPREFLAAVRGARARIALNGGDEGGARADLAAWAKVFQVGGAAAFYRWIAVAEVDECLAQLGNHDLVAEVYAEIAEWEPVRLGGISPRGLDHVRGALALRLDLIDEAEQHYHTGLEWSERERCPVEQGRNHQGLAEVAVRRNQTADAMQHLDDASNLFEQHGAKLYLGQVHKLQEELGAASGGGRSSYPDGLSGREVEVLRLVAAGMTNAEIANRLVIAPATAARHVHNILTKAGLANRAEAAAYAAKRGLLD